MNSNQFAEQLISNVELQKALKSLVVKSVQHDFKTIEPAQTEEFDWKLPLFVGSVLCSIDGLKAKDTALRIANGCILSSGTTKEEREAARVILERLSNYPAIELATKRQAFGESRDHLPVQFWLETSSKRNQQTEFLPNHDEGFLLNGFQRKFWDSAQRCDWLSLTAPTSGGKSFIVQKWIEREVASREDISIVYLAPTRALVHEVEVRLRETVGVPDSGVDVLTIPSAILDSKARKKVLVLTQERYQILLSRTDPTFRPYLVMVDEAQKIGDGARGVLLQQVIEETTRRSPTTKVLLASPFVENPEALHRSAPPEAVASTLDSSDVTVTQNIVWATQVRGKPRRWNLEAIHDSSPLTVGTIDLHANPAGVAKKLAFLAWALGKADGGNLIYVNTSDEAERVAALLTNLEDEVANDELKALSELAERAVHRNFALTATVLRGVAFHYGGLPMLLRLEVERCFKEGHLKYLICTSTLVEGVNLPCRNLFARGPRRGPAHPMTMPDFWNLAGRAGRLGFEFQGNVVCIDPTEDVWKGGVPRNRAKATIRTPSDDLQEQAPALARLAKGEVPDDRKSDVPHLMSLLSYALTDLHYNPEKSPFAGNATESTAVVEAYLRQFDLNEVPFDIIRKNPGVSLEGIKDLLHYFSTTTEPLAHLVPVPVAAGHALASYQNILSIINETLAPGAFGTDKYVYACALISVDWMKGVSLPRLIDNYRGRRSAPAKSPWPTDIRHVMHQVENVARYQVPRLISCYMPDCAEVDHP